MLHCVDALSGELIWRKDTTLEFGVVQYCFGVGSTPLVYGDLLLVMIGGSPEESRLVPRGQWELAVPNGTGIVALDKAMFLVAQRVD